MPARCLRVASFVCILAIALCYSPWAGAQTETATIRGSVTDATGALVPQATVRLVNIDRGTSTQALSNGSGFYSFPSVLPGRYRMEVEKSGFKVVHLTGITANVQDNLEENFKLDLGAMSESITVEAGGVNVNTTDASVSTVIDRNFVESLPLNGRSFNTLLQLTPGVVIAPAPLLGTTAPGQFSIAGQRTDANNFTIDGVSANFGVSTSQNLGQSGTGSAQAFSATGGTSSLVSVEALQEYRVETSSFNPEFGRSPGGQVILTTRSGTNEFHGGIYEYFRNDVMDANDWFANQAGISRASERHNDFGGFLGGRIWRDKTFFFVSYEGARLRVPKTGRRQVPSEYARSIATAGVAPFLNAYPQPNDRTVTPGIYTATFTGSFSNSATLDAGSVRIDHKFNDRISLFGRYNDAPSQTVNRVNSLNMVETSAVNTKTLTVGGSIFLTPKTLNSFRANYSTQSAYVTDSLDSFGGATPLDLSLLLGSLPASASLAPVNIRGAGYYASGGVANNRTRQLNLVDYTSMIFGKHAVRFGADYRAIFLYANPYQHYVQLTANSVQSLVSTSKGNLSTIYERSSQFLAQSLSLFGQDTWKLTPRLTITYGLRWELSPAPSARGNTTLASWRNVNNPAAITLAPPGTRLWNTTYSNFGPRMGVAYSLTQSGDFVIRAGAGIFYDLGVGGAADLASIYPNAAFGSFRGVSLPVSNVNSFLPTISLQPPYGFTAGFTPNLKLPRSYQWNLALEKSFGGKQAISATYVGQAGRNLLRQEALFQPNPNFSSEFLLTQNDARSNYNALQLQYRRPLSQRVQALLNYTWSHSLDSASNDVAAGISNTVISAASDYASSDFDVRHSFSGALSYAIPSARLLGPIAFVMKDWSVDTVVVARTGIPFNGIVFSTSPDPGGSATSRPDRVLGQPSWVLASSAPGGKILNANAFLIPSTVRQGTEGRNDIPGFGLTQVDVSITRKFPIKERFKFQFRADAFNVFNHPNFANPFAFVEFGPPFLQSPFMLNNGLGGLNPLFQEGGPRSLQLSLKLAF